MRQFWLVNKNKKKIALYPSIINNKVEFKIIGDGYEKFPSGFNPENGTVKRAIVNCPVCGSTIDAKTTKLLFQNKSVSENMIAVVTQKKDTHKKNYRIAKYEDFEILKLASKRLSILLEKLSLEIGLNPVPDEKTPEGKGRGAERAFSLRNYQLNKWGDLFNLRQKLSLLTFLKLIKKVNSTLNNTHLEKEYIVAIITYLALSFDRLATRNSNVCVWHSGSEQTEKVFAIQAFPMQWSYPESNPLNIRNVTGFLTNVESILNVIKNLNFTHTYANILNSDR